MADGTVEITWPPRANVTNVNSEVVRMRFGPGNLLQSVERMPVR
tara:strand:- start:46770 stop:46901 length:132 start_codon:yes stop_codon:yes gene_type:complete